jgi:hypothetical protein
MKTVDSKPGDSRLVPWADDDAVTIEKGRIAREFDDSVREELIRKFGESPYSMSIAVAIWHDGKNS